MSVEERLARVEAEQRTQGERLNELRSEMGERLSGLRESMRAVERKIDELISSELRQQARAEAREELQRTIDQLPARVAAIEQRGSLAREILDHPRLTSILIVAGIAAGLVVGTVTLSDIWHFAPRVEQQAVEQPRNRADGQLEQSESE